ncbi:LysR family transcriptional regulator [Senegalia massiliensis]|uniref:LysR family transcriptional regulator n=1 Tax=Senegalia massiliensis TaxID=1720316 RepID=A0A845QYH1_9CLOT|nr:LysR family transcriptional regulator [Senegalia massiliensis]NBI06192.1 LysR family transcriptional regulator [Senegalia massiliensis]
MTIRHLKIFIEVVETGKMSVAANNLFLAQPTISQVIKELEEHYDALLFERLNRKLYITEEGKKLLSYARKLVKEFDKLEENMSLHDGGTKINIGATITIGNSILSEIINNIKNEDKKIHTYTYVNNTSIIEDKLVNSELDIAIVEGEIQNPNLITIDGINDYLILTCSKNHKLANRKKIKLEELKDMDFVMREKGSGTRKTFEDYMNAHNIDINTVWECGCPGAMKDAVLNNNCMAVLSARLVEDEMKNGEIKMIENREFIWERNFSIVYHKDKIIDEKLKTIIKVIKDYRKIDIFKNSQSEKQIKSL